MILPDRIYSQYRDKPKARQWFQIVRNLAYQLVSTSTAVRVMYNIDTAEGEQLDVIGRIVGIGRAYPAEVYMNPGVFAELTGDEFGDTSAMFSNEYMWQNSGVSDDVYRILIKSKIIKNNSDGTIESALYGLNFVLPNIDELILIDYENMSFGVLYGGELSSVELWALYNLNLIVKPQGVRLIGIEKINRTMAQFGDVGAQFGNTRREFSDNKTGRITNGIETKRKVSKSF